MILESLSSVGVIDGSYIKNFRMFKTSVGISYDEWVNVYGDIDKQSHLL